MRQGPKYLWRHIELLWTFPQWWGVSKGDHAAPCPFPAAPCHADSSRSCKTNSSGENQSSGRMSQPSWMWAVAQIQINPQLVWCCTMAKQHQLPDVQAKCGVPAVSPWTLIPPPAFLAWWSPPFHHLGHPITWEPILCSAPLGTLRLFWTCSTEEQSPAKIVCRFCPCAWLEHVMFKGSREP